MTDIKETRELLFQKRDLVTYMLNATKETAFTGSEKDAERYITLVEKRQELIEEITSIEAALSQEPHASIIANATGDFKSTIEQVNEIIKKESVEIIDIDKKNEPLVKQAETLLRSQIKGVKTGKNMKNTYQPQGVLGAEYTSVNRGG